MPRLSTPAKLSNSRTPCSTFGRFLSLTHLPKISKCSKYRRILNVIILARQVQCISHMIRNEKGAAAVEYVLVAVIMSAAAIMVLGPGSVFFWKVGEAYQAIADHVSIAGNWLVATGL
jgi:Flp pilus assembly pilin Flp